MALLFVLRQPENTSVVGPEIGKNTGGKTSCQSTTSGRGEQFPRLEGMWFLLQALVCRLRSAQVKAYMTTGHSVETQEFLTNEPKSCRHMPLLTQL